VSSIELHRKIMNLERTIAKKETKVKELKQKVVAASQGNTECCCDELRLIFEEKEQKLMQLTNYWRTKTQQMMSLSQQEVQTLKN